MPTISAFYGLSIRMYWNEHLPPHFHAIYGRHKAAIRIDSVGIMHGYLPRRARLMTLKWAAIHRLALLENWDLCAKKLQPNRIPPLK